MNILQWAVWGSYLTSMGSYLASVGLATRIGIFYSMQGIVSIFMPTLHILLNAGYRIDIYADPYGYRCR